MTPFPITSLFDAESTLTRKRPEEISPVATSLSAASPAGPIDALGFLNTAVLYPISTETAATDVPL